MAVDSHDTLVIVLFDGLTRDGRLESTKFETCDWASGIVTCVDDLMQLFEFITQSIEVDRLVPPGVKMILQALLQASIILLCSATVHVIKLKSV